ncbi:MAG TPA: LapA family protein [Candidatus Macondimonas sp.]|nr:LapA family protein [Candidatus Macondimonas sp.]
MRLLALICSLILVAVFAVLAWQNATPVQLMYPGGAATLPLAVLVFLVLSAGWVFGVATMAVPWARQRMRLRKMAKRYRLAEQEIANLRDIPLKNAL